MTLTNRLRKALQPALIYGWKIEQCGKRALWDGDTTMPFRAMAALENLVLAGLMERELAPPGWQIFRCTPRALAYVCRAPSCQRGALYAEGLDGYDVETGKCEACAGTGVTLTPNAS